MSKPPNETEYIKRGDSILEERLRLDDVSTVIKLFDFDAAEVTTIQRSLMSLRYGEAVSVDASTQTLVQGFNDVAERKLKSCHAKLIELGGSPPPLDDTVTKHKTKTLKLG